MRSMFLFVCGVVMCDDVRCSCWSLCLVLLCVFVVVVVVRVCGVYGCVCWCGVGGVSAVADVAAFVVACVCYCWC